MGKKWSHKGKHSRDKIEKLFEKINKKLEGLESVDELIACGSYRRKSEECGDLDILIITDDMWNASDAVNILLRWSNEVLVNGPKKTSVMIGDIQLDIYVISPIMRGAAMLHFTGPMSENIILRVKAKKRGFKLNETGLIEKSSGETLYFNTEEEIYEKLETKYKEPWERIKRF